MTALLTRLFIRDRENVTSPAVRSAYGTMVSIVAICLNLLLFAAKYAVGWLTGSIAVPADAFNNLADAGTSLISLITFRIAAKPADRDHPFGHARIEYVSSMIVSFLILLVGWELLSGSIDKIIHPAETVFSWISVAVLAVSVVVKLWLCFFNRKIAKKIDSSVMRATAADSLSDAGATAAVLAATLIFKFTGWDPDAYMGILVALLILWAGIKILNDTKNSILGEKPSEETVAQIEAMVKEFEGQGAIGIHDLVVHDYGPGRLMITLHAEVPVTMDIGVAHDMIDNIEVHLSEELNCHAVIHMDPVDHNDPKTIELRNKADEIVKGLCGNASIHDFRVVYGNTHTNLVFDVLLPFDSEVCDKDFVSMVQKRVKAYDEKLNCVIHIDKDYVGH